MTGVAPVLGILLAYAAFPASHSGSGAQRAGDIDVVATEDDAANRMTVPVRIGDRGPYRFLLDTGSQNTVLSSVLATELALARGRRATIIGVAGSRSVDTVALEEITLGKRSYFGLEAPLLDREDIGADGILGLDSLQDQRVLIDFRRNLMAVDDARALGGDSGYEIVVRARRRSGQLIITRAEVNGVSADVVIDTGAEASIGNRALQAAMARRNMRAEPTVLSSVTGQHVTAAILTAARLTLGQASLTDVAIVFADVPAFAAMELNDRPALLLGMRELRGFRRVAIDFSSRKILFDVPEAR